MCNLYSITTNQAAIIARSPRMVRRYLLDDGGTICERPTDGLCALTARDRIHNSCSYLSASFIRRTLMNGSALSASDLTSLARSSINSSMRLPNKPGRGERGALSFAVIGSHVRTRLYSTDYGRKVLFEIYKMVLAK